MSVIHCNRDNFEEEVIKSSGLVVVDFFASWCGPCQIMGPIFEEVAKEEKGVKFVKVEVDASESGNLAEEYGVSSIPTFILFRDGREVGRFSGARNKDQLKEEISRVK